MTPDQQSARANISEFRIDLRVAHDHADGLASGLHRAGQLARNLDRGLARACDSDSARKLAGDLTRELARGVDVAHALAGALEFASHVSHDFDLDLDLTRASNVAYSLEIALEDSLDRARGLEHDLAAYDPGLPFACGLDLTRARDMAGDLMQVTGRAEQIVRYELNTWQDARSGPEILAKRPTLPARRLATMAAWLLPARERVRYCEEYLGELHDLAATGAGHRQQLSHAVGLLAGAVPLRVAVLAPRRGKAS